LIDYETLAQQLGMPRGTLSRKIGEFNELAKAKRPPQPTLDPDKIEDHGHYKKHFFKPNRVAEIQAALLTLPAGKRGRPKK